MGAAKDMPPSPGSRSSAADLQPTPTDHALPFRTGKFRTLAQCLDYAAEGQTGLNFYDGRGRLSSALTYQKLREDAEQTARRLMALNLSRGERVAMVADTSPDFVIAFLACQYAGLIPVPLPAKTSLTTDSEYVRSLSSFLGSCEARVGIEQRNSPPYLHQASQGLPMSFCGGLGELSLLPASSASLRPTGPDELAYIQYTSGSTRFPRGVMMKSSSVLDNLDGIVLHGVQVSRHDRCVSWLPFYHDMGLVGLMLTPIATQRSGDYLDSRSFAIRPRLWLDLLNDSKASMSFSPPFGYELCSRRLRPEQVEKYDLSNWRVAGVGAEMVRADVLERFADLLAPAKFDRKAFLPCYGMAECALAVSFAGLGSELETDTVDLTRLSEECVAEPAEAHSSASSNLQSKGPSPRTFVVCGKPLEGYEVEIRDPKDGNLLPERRVGAVFVRGSSVMSGYYGNPEATASALSEDGWLNTGDLGYFASGKLVITGRQKDLIIIAGRNIWPQDIEQVAESQKDIRSGDALAFSAPSENGGELAVVVVQCRESCEEERQALVKNLSGQIRKTFAIDCLVQLVPMHTLPRTSSGKLSRSRARENFIRDYPASRRSAV